MKKSFIPYCFFLILSVFFNITAKAQTGNKLGSKSNPYTVQDIYSWSNEEWGKKARGRVKDAEDAWVVGKILGIRDINGCHIVESITVDNANIIIGTDTTPGNYIPVNLPSKKNRQSFIDAYALGKELVVYGKLQNYFSIRGLKNTVKDKFYSPTQITLGGAENEEVYYTSLYASKDFPIVKGMEVGLVKSINGENIEVEWYTRGNVPKETGCIIRSKETTHRLYEFENRSIDYIVVENNLLKGSLTKEMTTGGNLYYKLALDKEGKNPGFYWGAEGGEAFENEEGKAYLPLEEVSAAPILYLTDGPLTVIQSVKPIHAKGVVYTLQGKRVANTANLPKGIYLVGGKKVIF